MSIFMENHNNIHISTIVGNIFNLSPSYKYI